MRKTLIAVALGALAAPLLACGPDFPPELLGSRDSTALELPEGMFAFESTRLLQPAGLPQLQAAPPRDWNVELTEEEQLAPAERGLSPAQRELQAQMRAATDPLVAADLGAALPADVRLYAAGAVAWDQGDHSTAAQYFQAVLALPEAERRLRSVWAAFMLGRIARDAGDMTAAAGHFQQAREFSAAGLPDPDELGLSSYGAEAKYWLEQQDWGRAVAGYAEEAARGSDSGRASLLIVARQLLRSPEQLAQAIREPLVQKLVGAYAFSRAGELAASGDYDPETGEPLYVAGAEPSKDATHPPLAVDRIAAAAEAAGLQSFAGADRLAAAAYQAGRFELAARYLKLAEGPLAQWVDAKLKLRAGDDSGAAAALAAASKAFAASEEWNDHNQYLSWPTQPQCRIEGERAVLSLGRGDYVAAAEHLFHSGPTYWADLAYVAERVLTLDELVALTTRLAPAYKAPPARKDGEENWEAWPLMADQDVGNLLRYLSARRLLRAGRHAEALAWFDRPELKPKAEAYVQAVTGGAAGDAVERARQLAAAAQLARSDGMELLGYEGDPDYQVYGGNFDLNDPIEWDAEYNPIYKPRSDLKVEGKFSTPAEQERLAQSRAQPLERFHYRYVAADHARAAAALLPPRSQAYAALLCKATAYVINRSPELGGQIYRQYVSTGPFVPWGQVFGRGDSYGNACPAPDFDRVEAQLRAERIAQLKRIAKYSLAPLGVLVAGGLGLWWWRRRKVA